MLKAFLLTNLLIVTLVALITGVATWRNMLSFSKCTCQNDQGVSIVKNIDYWGREIQNEKCSSRTYMCIESSSQSFSNYDLLQGPLPSARTILWIFFILEVFVHGLTSLIALIGLSRKKTTVHFFITDIDTLSFAKTEFVQVIILNFLFASLLCINLYHSFYRPYTF